MTLLPWLLALVAIAVVGYLVITKGGVVGGGSLDAQGRQDNDRANAPDDSGDALSRSIGDTVASAFRVASLWSKRS